MRWSDRPDDVFRILTPASPLFWDPFGRLVKKNADISSVETFVETIFSILITVGFLAFEAQSYYVLSPRHLSLIAVLWGASLSITVFCLLMVGLIFRLLFSPRKS